MTLITTRFFCVSAPKQAPIDARGVSISPLTTLSEEELDLVSGSCPKGGWSEPRASVSGMLSTDLPKGGW